MMEKLAQKSSGRTRRGRGKKRFSLSFAVPCATTVTRTSSCMSCAPADAVNAGREMILWDGPVRGAGYSWDGDASWTGGRGAHAGRGGITRYQTRPQERGNERRGATDQKIRG